MRVLVLGSGAKDHAIVWWFSRSRLIDGLFAAPGNVGTEIVAENIPDINPSNPEEVFAACQNNRIDFVFIGTEAPLFTGVIDYLNERGIDTFGAPSYALKLEGDRCFARHFMNRHNISTPDYHLFSDTKSLEVFLKRHPGKQFVVKKNTLSPSRVMIESSNYDKLMEFSSKLLATDSILLEEHLDGMPITVSVLLDKNGYLILPYCSEYTKSDEADGGSATGGMGAICPISLPSQMQQRIIDEIIQPTIFGMKAEKLAYKGVMTFSIIISDNNPVLVDYHVRFNDPATQSFVPIIDNDIVELMEAIKTDTINECKLQVSTGSTVCVVIASKGYPENPSVGKEVKPIAPVKKFNLSSDNPYLFFGAVDDKDGKLHTCGGRCVSIVGHGVNIIKANSMAYSHIDDVSFDGAWYRKDIGNKFFEQ
jgi:phosphoribosylamine---glycine ligase